VLVQQMGLQRLLVLLLPQCLLQPITQQVHQRWHHAGLLQARSGLVSYLVVLHLSQLVLPQHQYLSTYLPEVLVQVVVLLQCCRCLSGAVTLQQSPFLGALWHAALACWQSQP
jgi:hypothetical protein